MLGRPKGSKNATDVVGRFPGEMAALVLIWATLEEDRLVWRGAGDG